MKRLLLPVLLLFMAVHAFSQLTYPQPENDYVNDFAGVISPNDASAIEKSLGDLRRQTGIHMTVVTINSLADYGASEVPFDTYAAILFDTWGIGDIERNDGILLFFSLNDRQVRIEMGEGYAHRYDSQIQQVVDAVMLPSLRNNEFSRGIYDGVYGTINVVTKKVSRLSYHKWHIIGGILVIICILAGISCMKKGKKGWGWAFFAAAAAVLLFLFRASGRGGKGFGGGRSGGGGGGGGF